TWFPPVHIQVGPDGARYVADLYEQRSDHATHYQRRVDRDSGRIYRIRNQNAIKLAPFDLAKLSAEELIEVLRHDNKWYRQEALRIIADRRDPALIPQFKKLIGQEEGQVALESLWALYVTGGLDDQTAAQLLGHTNPFVRLWTVRLMCDARQ